jgi:molybdopterin molybdotransferase
MKKGRDGYGASKVVSYHSEMPSGSPTRVVSFEEARHIVEEHASKLRLGGVAASGSETGALFTENVESVELPAARGRVLAEPIIADRDFPPFPRATRDGYAVRAADVERTPATLKVIGEIKAGDSPKKASLVVSAGEAVSIMTGAPVPEGADAVVMVEYTSVSAEAGNGSVEIQRAVKSGENFVPRAAEAHAGQLLVDRGHRLDHALIAIAASVGKSRVAVFRRPRVAVLSTGDELVEIGSMPGPSQIRNSNSYSLAAQIEEVGAEAVRLPIAPDEPVRLRALIEEGLSCDLLLLTGGVSMGKYDLVEQVLAELNAEFYFTGSKIQPGKPVVFGWVPAATSSVQGPTVVLRSSRAGAPAPHGRYFLGLPGNPVSTMVTFELFAKPMIAALGGMKPEPLVFSSARLKSAIQTKTGLKRFLPAILSGEFENAEVELARWQGSGDIATLAQANCYVVVPEDREQIEAGEWVPLLPR